MKHDIIVCGAGIVGMATALGLARSGVKDVVLLGNTEGQMLDRPDLLKVNVAAIDSSGSPKKPSSETIMHTTIYKNQPLAKAVFHAHPPTAVAYSVAHPKDQFFPLNFISELILALGQVPIVAYQRPGTSKMGEALVPFLADSKVLILQFHGAVSWGESIDEAYMGIERLEHAAEIYLKAQMMGRVGELPESEIQALVELRKKIGFKTL